MLDGMFVFDNAIHVYDMSDANLRASREDSRFSRDQLAGLGAGLGWPGVTKSGAELAVRWSIEDVYEMVFVDSPTDMAMAQMVPMFDWFEGLFAPVQTQHAMASATRTACCSAAVSTPCTRPGGRAGAARPPGAGAAARLDQVLQRPRQRRLALRRRADRVSDLRALPRAGDRVLQFHKGIPYGLQNIE